MKAKMQSYIFRFSTIVLMCVILTISGCGGNSWVDDRLDEAERLMENRPDSALAILDSIHPAILNDAEQKARYALLKSMALDKNFIDKISFDVLQPAIDYYVKEGTPDEKLRTNYYQGRIYQNRNERDSALIYYARALDISNECKDSLTIVRTLVAEGGLYKNFYDINGYFRNYLRAADILKDGKHVDYEFECLLNALNGAIILKKKEQADSIMEILDGFKNIDRRQSIMLEGDKLSYILQFESTDKIVRLLDKNISLIAYDTNGILNLAHVYNKVGDNATALNFINSLDEKGVDYDTLKYESIKFNILEDLRRYNEALDVYKSFTKRLDGINASKFEQKNRTMEEKHRMELQAEKAARKHARMMWEMTGCVCSLLMVLVIILLAMRSLGVKRRLAEEKARTSELENENLKSEKERLELTNQNLQLERDKKALEAENLAHRVVELESESDGLRELLESQQEMPAEVRKAIQTRIEMLNSYLASQISDNKEFEKTYDAWVADLTANTREFMDSNRLAFQASHPAFIKYFEDHGLTTDEINYVCLYAIGLRGKDVGNYMRKRSHVNISSAIRKKLGIDQHETNIGIYVRKLLKEL